LAACTEDFVFNVPGRGAMAGRWSGKEGMYQLAQDVLSITGGTFQEEVEDVLANDSHAVVLARHSFTRAGEPRSYRTAHVYKVRGGKLAECWEQPRDPAAFEDAWGPRIR
jgi:ketosteroid isomerase-like protein